MRLPNTIGELTSKDRNSGGLWVSDVSLYLLWFEFLAISPSYELARRYRAGECTSEDVFPTDFDLVLSVFDDLGDVQKRLFSLWWEDVGLTHFGYQGKPPTVTQVAYATHSEHTAPNLSGKVAEYFEGEWVYQGRQRTMLLAVPIGLPEGIINKQIKSQLAKVKPQQRELIKPKAKYPLVGKRHHKDALLRCLRLAWMRSVMYRKSLWRAGAEAEISDTYSPVLDPKLIQVSAGDRYDREMLTILASRALLRARMIAENAARGRFPTHATCPNALKFDLKELRTRINRRNIWLEPETKRFNREHGLQT
jgi:hypothetical protein